MKPKTLGIPLLLVALQGCGKVEQIQAVRNYERIYSSASQTDTTDTTVKATRDDQGRAASLISAFFGLDDALPKAADQGIWNGAGGTDGMPVIFSHEIDFRTMDAGDFKVTTQSGKTGEILAVTLAPADDLGEHRTVLLSGQYGSVNDQPARVEIVGNLLSIDHEVNFKGVSVKVTPLEEGASLVWCEVVPQREWELGKKPTALAWGRGSGASLRSKQVLRVTWSGGVTKPAGGEVDDTERQLYKVKVRLEDGKIVNVTPFALGDLGDGDNNHELCLDVVGTPISVSFPGGKLKDPRKDLNPATTISFQESQAL